MGPSRIAHPLARLVAYVAVLPRELIDLPPDAAAIAQIRQTMAQLGLTGSHKALVTDDSIATNKTRNVNVNARRGKTRKYKRKYDRHCLL